MEDVYSVRDLNELMRLAAKYCYGSVQCEVLYRNKSQNYFDNIAESKGNIMEVYKKDQSGDRRSPINGKLDGLFFSASPPNNQSVFGRRRILIPAALLADNCHLYFADFYCMLSHWHYITIVMAPKGSYADKFCAARLVRLKENDNPFFFKDGDDYKVASSIHYLLVEVFYTANIDLIEMAERGMRWEDVTPICSGSSTIGGRPKNSYCVTCNVKPLPRV